MFNDLMHDPKETGCFASSEENMVDYMKSMAERDNVEVAGYVLYNKTTEGEEYFVQPWYDNEIDYAINGWNEINPKTGKTWLPNWKNYKQIKQVHIHIGGGVPSESDAWYSTSHQVPVIVYQKVKGGYTRWKAFQYNAAVPKQSNGIYGKPF